MHGCNAHHTHEHSHSGQLSVTLLPEAMHRASPTHAADPGRLVHLDHLLNQRKSESAHSRCNYRCVEPASDRQWYSVRHEPYETGMGIEVARVSASPGS